MARINLLPWREEYRKEKKKEFLTQLGGIVVLTVLVAFVWVQSVNSAIDAQKARNNILESEIGLLAKAVEEIKNLKKRRQELLDRMRVIQDLEGKRSIIVHYFDEMVQAMPDGVYLTSFQRSGDSLILEGVSESNIRISTFMRQLDDSDWFSAPNLKSVVAAPELGEQTVVFNMQVEADLPDSEKEDPADG